ncbi:derlin-1.1 [Trifolium repens]|nr:derlin-1.1 [Trifolium repens]
MAAVPDLWSPYNGISLVSMIVYVWSREFPNEIINIYDLVSLKSFYLPWAMLALDLLFGNPIMADILGIVAGHLYYFLTVLHPLAGGNFKFKTPLLVHKLVAYWGEGTQMNSPVQLELYLEEEATVLVVEAEKQEDGIAFRGRSYRLNE